MYSTQVCSLVNLRGGWGVGGGVGGWVGGGRWVGGGGGRWVGGVGGWVGGGLQRENQNKEKLTKVAAYEL